MDLEFYFIVLTASLSSLSLIANIWVTYVYFSFKELQRHPSTILSYISLFEISMSHHSIALILDSNLSIRGHGPHHMLQLITFFILDEQSARKISCAINQMFFSGAVAGVLCYNTFLSVDLMITLRNPLIAGKTRMKYYHLTAFVLVLLNMSYNLVQNLKYTECAMSALIYLYQVWNYGMITIVYFLLLISALVSILYISCKKKEKINTQTRTYLMRHIKYLIAVTTIWTFCTLLYWMEEDDQRLISYSHRSFYLILVNLSTVSASGAIQALLRNWEPAFWKCSKSVCSRKNRIKLSIVSDVNSTMIRDFRESEDMWNMPMSFIIQENMKSSTTLCILSGIFETLKAADFSYKMDFHTSSERKVVRQKKIRFSEVMYRIPGLNFCAHPFFIVEEYCPVIFNRLRLLEGLSKGQFLKSLDPEVNEKTLFSASPEVGGSGSLFIFTEDNRFVIKVLQRSEREFFINDLLEDYLDHIEKNCMSLLNRIFGIFTIKIPGLAPLDLMLTQSLLTGSLVKYYDLKGSSYNRLSESIGHVGFKGPFKDTDFLAHEEKICLERVDREQVTASIVKDFDMLLEHGIMDYSLIITIVRSKMERTYMDAHHNVWYRFGVIDFFGQYSFKRKAEYYFKKIMHGKNIKLCSVMQPKNYYSRILEFLLGKVFLAD